MLGFMTWGGLRPYMDDDMDYEEASAAEALVDKRKFLLNRVCWNK